MAEKKTQRQLRDEAYLKSQQVDLLTESIPVLSSVVEPQQTDGVPDACPACAHTMKLSTGWTALAATTAGHGVLQCGYCGHSIAVPLPVYTTYRAALKALADARAARIADRQPKKRDGRRTRGAG